MGNRGGAYARFFALRGAKVVANDTGCDVHGDGVDAAVKDGAAIVYAYIISKICQYYGIIMSILWHNLSKVV